MTSRTSRPSIARRIVLLSALALAVALPFAAYLMANAVKGTSSQGWEDFDVFVVGIGVLGITNASVGVIILWRKAGNVIGAALLAGALLLMGVFLAWPTSAYRGATVGPTDFIGGLAQWWGTGSFTPAIFLLFPCVGILFPDGRPPSPRWHLPFACVVTMLVIGTAIASIAPWPLTTGGVLNPFALSGLPPSLADLGNGMTALALLASFVMAVIAVAVRFRRSSGVERAQLKWLLPALAITVVGFPISAWTDIEPIARLTDVASISAGCLIPVAIGIAILRYRLYDIDRLVSRTISYALVTGILLAVYGGIVLLLSALTAPFIPKGASAIVAISTLAVSAIFQPVLRRVRRAVDRRFDRARYDGERTATAFSERLRDEVDMGTVTTDLTDTTGSVLAPAFVGIWLRPRGTNR